MLSLVRSQRACVERLHSAVRWSRGLVLLIGAPALGKTTVVKNLITNSPYLPLQLDGRVITDRRDAILRLVALVGVQPEESDLGMLNRLQIKQSVGVEKGIPEIIIDNAHCLSEEVIQLVVELAFGAYGRPWSILAIGEPSLGQMIASTSRFGSLASIVKLPVWDEYDFRQAAQLINPDFSLDQEARGLLERFSSNPGHLLRSLNDGDYSNDHNVGLAEEKSKEETPQILS